MLTIEKAAVSHGQILVVRDVSLEVQKGEIVSLVGSNGAGKTTLLYAVSGLIRLKSGQIRFEGQRIDQMSSHRIVREGLIQVPEGRKIFPSLTVLENLELGSFHREAKKSRKKNLEHVFGFFPRLAERQDQPASTLSGGEQQMLAIARGLMGEPKLLILDEPSLGLSPKIVSMVFEKIKLINKEGASILLAEQNIVQSLRISDRGYIIEQGRTVRSAAGLELLQDPQTRQCFLADLR